MKLRPDLLPLILLVCSVPLAAADGLLRLNEISVVNQHAEASQPSSAVITAEEIETTQSNSMAEVVASIPGVTAVGSSRFGGQTINIWGRSRVEDINFTVDGAQKGFRKYRQGSVFIDPEIIQRIRITKGPSNIHAFGRGLGGSVEADTKNPEDYLSADRLLGGALNLGYHTNDKRKNASLALAARDKSEIISGLVFFKKSQSEDITIPRKTPSSINKFYAADADVRTLFAKVKIVPNYEHAVTLSYIDTTNNGWTPFASMNGIISRPTAEDIQDYNGDIAKVWRSRLVYRELKDQSFSAAYNYTPSNNPLVDLKLTATSSITNQRDTKSEKTLWFMGQFNDVKYEHNNFSLINKGHFDLYNQPHRFSVGLIHSRVKVTSFLHSNDTKHYKPEYNFGDFQIPYMPSGTQIQSSLFADDLIKFNKFDLYFGARYDHVRNSGVPNIATIFNDFKNGGHDYRAVKYNGMSYYLGGKYFLTDGLNVNVLATRTWSPPSLSRQYEVQESHWQRSMSSRQLRSELIWAFQLGLEYKKNNLFVADDEFSSSISYIHNRSRYEIFRFRGHVPKDTQFTKYKHSNSQNLPKNKIYGFEFDVNYTTNQYRVSLAGSSLQGWRDSSVEDANERIKTWYDGVAPPSLNLEFGYRPKQNIELGWSANVVGRVKHSMNDAIGRYSWFSLFPTNGYATHAVFVKYSPANYPNLNLNLRIDNIFNKYYEQYLSAGVPGMGRDIRLTMQYKF